LKDRKEALLDVIQDPAYVPMKLKELAILLSVPKERRDELKEVLDALVAEGKAGLSKRGKYGKPETVALTGMFSGTAKGFGFVTVEGESQDIYIPADRTKDAMHGDRVQVTVDSTPAGKRPEGAVVKVLERNMRQIVGTFQNHGSFGFVLPDDIRIIQVRSVSDYDSFGKYLSDKVDLNTFTQENGKLHVSRLAEELENVLGQKIGAAEWAFELIAVAHRAEFTKK